MAADGSIVVEAKIDDKQAQAELNRLNRKIENLNDQIEGKSRKRSYLVDQAQQIEAAYKDAIAGNQDMLAESLAKQYDRVQGSINRLDEQIKDHNTNIDIAKEKAGEYSAQLAGIGSAGEEAAKRADSGLARLEKRLMGLAKRVFVFSVFTKALRALKDYLAGTIKENAEAAAAIENLKASFESLVQPIVNAVIPALVFFLNVVTNLVNTLSSLFGVAKKAAGGLGKEEKKLSGVGGAAADAEKSLASFDEINKLSTSKSGGGGGIEAEETPNFSAQISPQLMAIGQLLTGIALVALGTILLFSGHVPMGIAMILAGGLAIYGTVSENWGYIQSALSGQLGAVVAIVSGALLAIGAVLAFSSIGALPIGLGLMVAGAAGLAAVVAVNWNSLVTALQGPIGAITAIVGGALMVIGAVLAFSGANIPLGIGLMVAGGLALGSVVAINWNSIVEILAGVWNAIKTGVTTAWNAIVTFLTGIWNTIKTGAVNAWNGLTGAFSTAATWFYNNVVSPIANLFVGLWDKLKNGATAAWDGIMSVFGTVATFFQLTFSRAWRGIVNIFSVAGEIFTDIKDGIVTAFKAIVNALIKGINKVIAIPFNAINSVLQKIHDVDILGVKPFKWIGTIAVPEIPLLAQGAVIPPNREFLAVLGDQKSGTNIETPLSTMVQAFKTALSEMNYNGRNEAVMVVDGEVFGRLAYKLGGKETTRVGVSLTGGGLA